MAYLIYRFRLPVMHLGELAAGAKAYVFSANTGAPLAVYQDYALTVPHTHPVVADAYGNLPAAFLAENITYRLRLETSGGALITDDMILTTDTDAQGGGGGDTPDPSELISTGHIASIYDEGTVTGYLLLDGETFGSAASGGTRANDSYEALYVMLWNNSDGDDVPLAVTGGRGSGAQADWDANKPMALPDYSNVGPLYIKI